MQRFFFHLSTPHRREVDELGILFANADEAFLEACRAALEISADALPLGGVPGAYRFEVCDAQGRLVFDLPFQDMVAGRRARPDNGEALKARVADSLRRGQELQAQLAASVLQVRATLDVTRALLARPAAVPTFRRPFSAEEE